MFLKLDGTGRTPRASQLDILQHIQNTKSKYIPILAATGIGKSYILRAIQLEYPGTVGIVSSNSLMNQYIETYPDINYVKGKAHYKCSNYPELNCSESQSLFNSKCDTCEYTRHTDRAAGGLSTVFNPISYYYFKEHNPDFKSPPVVVIDEAHKLIDTLNLLVEFSFSKRKYEFPENIPTFVELLAWIDEVIGKLKKIVKDTDDIEKKKENNDIIQRLYTIKRCYQDRPQDFIFFIEKRLYRGFMEPYLVIKPVSPPQTLINSILSANKVILLSATLLISDLWDYGINGVSIKEFPSPIPKENRVVKYFPTKVPVRYDTDPLIIVSHIKTVLDKNPNVNTIVHVSYGWSKKLQEYFPSALFNTSLDKDKVLKRFKEVGGVWFAAGCSEGIDLPGDQCRLVIIPIIFKPNPMDPLHNKKITRQDGRLKSDLEVVKTVIQQAGRASRSVEDWSVTIILDPMFPRIITKVRKYLPKSFLESIEWTCK